MNLPSREDVPIDNTLELWRKGEEGWHCDGCDRWEPFAKSSALIEFWGDRRPMNISGPIKGDYLKGRETDSRRTTENFA